MRSEVELWRIVLSKQDLFYQGLCSWVNNMHWYSKITKDERNFLHQKLKENLPAAKIDGFCWMPRLIKPRINWIEKRIKQLEKDELENN